MLSMTTPRALHAAAALRDGRVLVCGGTTNARLGGTLASAELYDPEAENFAPTGKMTAARQGHTATLLPNGQVLIVGGSQGVGFRTELASAELYDPVSSAFHSTGSMRTPREGHTATLLRDGRVLIAGGSPNGRTSTDSAEIYDPKSGRFTAVGRMTVPREAHTATLLRNGKVLIAGGGRAGMPGGYIAYDTAEIFNPLTGTFSPVVRHMVYDRVGHAAVLLRDGRVLLAGGKSGKIMTSRSPRNLFWFTPLETAEVFEPETNSFREVGGMRHPHYQDVATILRDGTVLVTGGWTLKGPAVVGMPEAELFNPVTGTFQSVGNLHVPRLEQTATLLPSSGQVMVAGGLNGEGNVTATVEFYTHDLRRFFVRPGQRFEKQHYPPD